MGTIDATNNRRNEILYGTSIVRLGTKDRRKLILRQWTRVWNYRGCILGNGLVMFTCYIRIDRTYDEWDGLFFVARHHEL